MDNAGIRASRKYRAKQKARMAQLDAGHREILAALAGNDKPLAVKVRTLAEAALGDKA